MLTLTGIPRAACDGVSRRAWLHVGSLAALGVPLTKVLAAREPASDPSGEKSPDAAFGQARACIVVYLFGGPSQIDLWDMKPDAPLDFRGEFRPIPTTTPGVSICEHMPRLAAQSQRFSIVRSMCHGHPRHGYGLYYMFTGREHPRPDLDAAPSPSDSPSWGAMVARWRPRENGFPPAITLPRWNRFLDLPNDYAGETAGFLGRTYEPWLLRGNADSSQFDVEGIEIPAELTRDRLIGRRHLWQQLDRTLARRADQPSDAADDVQQALYQRAFTLLASPAARRAFRIADEPAAVREQYGDTPFGRGLLLSRRLVEAGCTLVTVNWHNDGSDVKSPFWDTHRNNFSTLKERLLPPADRGLAALFADLHDRGLLESTLVVVMGEFGRTPRVGRVVMNAATNASGRDHWPHAYSILVGGGGVRGGHVFGASDERAAYVVDAPITPPDLTATVLHALGIAPQQTIVDPQGRPQRLSDGRPALAWF